MPCAQCIQIPLQFRLPFLRKAFQICIFFQRKGFLVFINFHESPCNGIDAECTHAFPIPRLCSFALLRYLHLVNQSAVSRLFRVRYPQGDHIHKHIHIRLHLFCGALRCVCGAPRCVCGLLGRNAGFIRLFQIVLKRFVRRPGAVNIVSGNDPIKKLLLSRFEYLLAHFTEFFIVGRGLVCVFLFKCHNAFCFIHKGNILLLHGLFHRTGLVYIDHLRFGDC